MFFLGRYAPCGGTLCAVVSGVLKCVFMVERNIKKLLLEALNKKGDNPEDVSCVYSSGFLRYEAGPVPMMPPSCLAANLPEGELAILFCHSKKYNYSLVKTDREIKIETSLNISIHTP